MAEIKADLAPWKHFDRLLKRPGGYETAEDIILHLTLFGEDRSLLRKWISRKYGTILSAEEQKQALSFRCSGWGRLSKIFLTELYHTDANTGEAFSLIDMLWNTNLNLMGFWKQPVFLRRGSEQIPQESSWGNGEKSQYLS